MTIRAVAWDIDGTLVDSEPLHHEALVTVCQRWQVDLSDVPDGRFNGVHMPDIWLALADRMPPTLTEQIWNDSIIDYYAAKCPTLEPTTGAIEAMYYFDERGVRQVCVSNSGRAIVDANIRALGIKERIVFSISLDDVRQGKPDPEPYATACARLGLRPRQVLAVEDSLAGLRSARAAGLLTAFYSPRNEIQADADVVVTDLRQLPEIARGFSTNRFSSVGQERYRATVEDRSGG
ncbi:HAD family phosphatase [Mesorhizobium sp. VK23B]|uniref:HAD family phosphatase n=1 Tax=Mesorhizobium dulcispinae TaxID=3072316 RepID=A0ABU4X9P3_9HYPH|nr:MULTISPECIES: HAD family phosphatase [unclassified Mesorhizobium]MDX8465677.1 HAD family phosphatase [Mesorhizobium sp. VK23B]MDX8471521.1 HAD family phosphatase [Mesorhizobium sp. VK23A]